MVSHLSEFSGVNDNFKCPYKKILETYIMHHVFVSSLGSQIRLFTLNFHRVYTSEYIPIYYLLYFYLSKLSVVIWVAILSSSFGILNTKDMSCQYQTAIQVKWGWFASPHICSSRHWLANLLLLPTGESINIFRQIMNGF